MTKQPKHIAIILIGICLLATDSQLLLANNAAELHQSNCIGCHARMTGGDGSVLYKRNDGIVNNKTELEQRVLHCANGASLNWSKSEITAVINYLNELVYQFP